MGLTSEVVWRIDNGMISREETLSSEQTVTVKSWKLIVPSSYGQVETEINPGRRTDRFTSNAGMLSVQSSWTTFPVNVSIVAAGDSPLGRGVHGAIPLHLVFEAHNLVVQNGKPLRYKVALSVSVKS